MWATHVTSLLAWEGSDLRWTWTQAPLQETLGCREKWMQTASNGGSVHTAEAVWILT